MARVRAGARARLARIGVKQGAKILGSGSADTPMECFGDLGVTPRGVVYASGDGGLTWDTRGALNGLAEAVEAISGREIYAAADSAVLVSRDGGRTFAPLTP
jgi:hypothetical protein